MVKIFLSNLLYSFEASSSQQSSSVDVNTADKAMLENIKGIGAKKAKGNYQKAYLFKIYNVIETIQWHLDPEGNRRIFLFLHIDEFQIIDEWDEENKMRGIPRKQLFRNTIHNLTRWMMSPSSHIFVQTFFSGLAPQVIIRLREPSKVSFRFVKCPLLSFKSMLEIAGHYAEIYCAKKFKCWTYKWMLCQHLLQLLKDTGGLPRVLEVLFLKCIRFDGKNFFRD